MTVASTSAGLRLAAPRRAAAGRRTAVTVRASSEDAAAKTADFSFGEAMAFSGVAPELINSRAAMVGFVAALGAEVVGNESITAQVADVAPAAAGLMSLLTLATFAPALRGENMDPKVGWEATKGSMFTDMASIELTNGRAAMLGLVGLFAYETISGSMFF